MSSKIRECINGLNNNTQIEKMLPEYVQESMQAHYSYAKLKLMMEYYIFYEKISEGINPYIDSAKDIAEKLHRAVQMLFGKKKLLEAEYQELAEEILQLRKNVTEKMQVLTAYVDRFVVFEYILNRVQYRFEEREVIEGDVEFAQSVLRFIFSAKDNAAVNDNIRAVLGQLPVRMTRNHYYDLIRDSISVYKGSDQSSLEGYLYMFRTNAMLYETPAMEYCFTEFIPVLKELEELDYENMDGALYQIYAEKIRVNASKLNDISDLYMQIQELINGIYSIILAERYASKLETIPAADLVISGINDLFLHENSDIWEATDGLQTDEEKIYWLGEQFPKIEGLQEKIYETITIADAVLEETWESHREKIEKLQLEEAFHAMLQLMPLSSNSSFVELEMDTKEEKVTSAKAEEAAEILIAEIKEKFKGQSRMVRRAIMANTLEKIPVFFTTSQEVADYVNQALSSCDDEAEKYASKQLIQEIMQ